MSRELSVVVWSKEGCHYCDEVKKYLQEREISYETIDVTNRDEWRDILQVKYNVRHVPVIEIGENNVYRAVTEVGIPHLERVLNTEEAKL
ncbi:glutaredoxin family protein [Metabacillus fastidiosus]|uniref:glutaredoxin family protein n=1 Tax=Metabacillus fastidiosus TaxID=1458 RepID=UPI002DBCFECA|nr:glutaredoxin family protein [Metabacillus fastidiosus]MEC2076157.1 glutaredoxin family protein [Metabacillus fastidiosus]